MDYQMDCHLGFLILFIFLELKSILWYNMLGIFMDKKTVRDLKIYAIVGQIALQTIVTIALGVGIGYLIDYLANTSYWIIIISLLGMVMAIVNFVYQLLKYTKN